jgi:hypothetical protein
MQEFVRAIQGSIQARVTSNRTALFGVRSVDLFALHGGTVFLWAGNPSAAVPFVSRSRMPVRTEEVYWRGTSRFPYQSRRVTGRVAGEERRDERGRHEPCGRDPHRAHRSLGLVVAENSVRAGSLEGAPPNGAWMALWPVPAPDDCLDARPPRHGQRSPWSARLRSGLLCEVFVRIPGRRIPSGMHRVSRGPGGFAPPRSRVQAYPSEI